jgi:hypothetical protein
MSTRGGGRVRGKSNILTLIAKLEFELLKLSRDSSSGITSGITRFDRTDLIPSQAKQRVFLERWVEMIGKGFAKSGKLNISLSGRKE